jgi:hypothetical protein
MGTGRTVLISKGGCVLRQQRFLFLFVSGIIPPDTGRRIGMGRYAMRRTVASARMEITQAQRDDFSGADDSTILAYSSTLI